MLPSNPISKLLWPANIEDEPLFSSFIEVLSQPPPLAPATFGEARSCSIDIPSLTHNAIRQELCDMFTMYRAMADLGADLTLTDIKASTLWFRAFTKFLRLNLLSWHSEQLFPWFRQRVELVPARQAVLSGLITTLNAIKGNSQSVYAKQARLSTEVSRLGRTELLRVQFVDAVCGAVELSEKLAQYFRCVESLFAPTLQNAEITLFERDELFQKIVLRMFENGTERRDLPILVRWMPRIVLKGWLERCAFDDRGRAISTATFNRWHQDYFGEQHLKIVQDVLRKASIY